MLTIANQKELIIDRLTIKYNAALQLAKFCRNLKLFERAKCNYHLAKGYNDSINIVNKLTILENKLTYLDF